MNNCCSDNQILGSDPISIRWNIVEGDTGSLTVDFFENNEVDRFDMTGWVFQSTVFDPKTNSTYVLDVETLENGSIVITADASTTSSWGNQLPFQTKQLQFDIQGVFEGTVVWTPVIGTIVLIGDVSTTEVLS